MTVTTIRKVIAPLKRVLPRAVWAPLRAVATGIITPLRFSVQTGHWKSSLRRAAFAADGTPIPWYTYPAIEFLKQRRFSDKNILEFGGGQSTRWWSRVARSVLTIEENKQWFEHLRLQLESNVTLHHAPVDHVTRTVEPIKNIIDSCEIEQFDVIVIDGHLRKELTALAFNYLAPNGAIILDNSEGYGFFEEICTRNCRRVDFFGFAPGVRLRHCTSVVFVGDCFLLWPDIPIPVIEADPHDIASPKYQVEDGNTTPLTPNPSR